MDNLTDRIAHPDRLFIGGEWVAPSSGKKLSVVSPATEAVIAEVPEAAPADIDRAVAAARRAFDDGPWPRMSPAERSRLMMAFADEIARRGDDLATLWSAEGGAPLSFTQPCSGLAVARIKASAQAVLDYPYEEVRPSYAGAAIVVREPVGVVAAILPWNAPVPLAAGKFGSALAAGCTIVFKPAPETPLHAYIFAECAEAAGLPPGVINLVAAGREGSDHLIRHHGVDKVSFTGSVATGKHIAQVCSERLARYTLELGGKSAAIMLDDADVAATAPKLAAHATTHAGQICFALTRILVPRSRQADYADALGAALAATPLGDPLDPATVMGPLAMGRQRDRVEGFVAQGRSEGARLVVGGGRAEEFNRGFYFKPTLFADADNNMTIAQEEIFGPVLTLIPYDGVDHAVAIANDSRYGLGGAVFTGDIERAYDVARRVRTGSFGHNGLPIDMNTAPFGGFKESGVGREGGIEGIDAFVELKTVYMPSPPARLQA